MIPVELQDLHKSFWNNQSHNYNMTHNEGCGLYTEAWVKFAKSNGYPKVEHLKKNPGQTQYNGHANDAFLYTDGTSNPNALYSAVDIIGAAESTDPLNPPRVNWGIDTPRYTNADIWLGNSNPNPIKTVPWVGYDENGFQRLKNMLKHDYERRPQGPDYDVSVWSGRYFHNCYMGPNGIPLGEQAALEKIKPELCAALGIPMDDYYGN